MLLLLRRPAEKTQRTREEVIREGGGAAPISKPVERWGGVRTKTSQRGTVAKTAGGAASVCGGDFVFESHRLSISRMMGLPGEGGAWVVRKKDHYLHAGDVYTTSVNMMSLKATRKT